MASVSVSKRIALVADDDEYFRMALSTILKGQLGFAEVVETGSFDEAVECLEGMGRVSFAIFDLSMPGIDSPVALRTIRESFDVEKLAVVSASTERNDILQSLDAGAHGFVSKGQGIGELRRALLQILEGVVYVPPALANLAPGVRDAPRNAPATYSGSETAKLTPRQRDVLQLLVKGKSNKEIARVLSLGGGTVKVHLAALFRTLGVANRAAAAVAGAELLRRLSSSAQPIARQPRQRMGNDD